LDDAGDAGFKFRKGSSRYFVIACIMFDDSLEVEYASVGLRVFRRSLGWKDTHEFKFNKNHRKDKLAFLHEANRYDFKIRAVIVDKTTLDKEEMKKSKKVFYLSVVRDVLLRFGDRLDDAKVYLDGDDIKGQTQKTRVFLRQALNADKKRMRKFEAADSVKEGLIQLADMVAGSIYRSLQPDKTDCNDYLSVIESKIEDLWHIP
jgi:hypothetical protein